MTVNLAAGQAPLKGETYSSANQSQGTITGDVLGLIGELNLDGGNSNSNINSNTNA